MQKKSYQWFLDEGLREVFADTASITDYTGNLELSFLDYTMDEEPKYSIEECKARDATYATPLKVRMRLRNKETDEIKEQEIFMGDFPKMTDSATFIINGAERAIVSQLVRSPGVYYGKELDKTNKVLLSTTVIPYHGAWLEYETDANDIFYVRIDKNRKIPITSFIRAIGVKTDAEIPDMTTGCSARKCSITMRASSPPSTRTPATPARRRSSRSTASSVRAIPRRWSPATPA